MDIYTLTQRIQALEQRLQELKAVDSPGNYALGSLLFGNASGIASFDVTNLVWDDTNKRLGIGTNSPSEVLHVVGNIKLSGILYPGNQSSGFTGNTLVIANNGVAAIGTNDFGFAFVHAQSNAAIYVLNGSTHTTSEVYDAGGIYTPAATTPSSINIYWSTGNTRYEIENKRGSTITVRLWILTST